MLNNFIMSGVCLNGCEYSIEMNDTETQMYKDSNFGEDFSLADEAITSCAERNNFIIDEFPQIITE